MQEKFMSLITEIGKKKITNSIALGTKVELSTIQVGDGNGSYYDISEKQTQLKNKVWEGNLSRVVTSIDNPNELLVEAYIPTDVGGFYIREAGLFDKDGDLIAIAKHPETYKPTDEFGSYKDLTIRIILAISNASNVVLKVDPTIIVATQEDLKRLENNIPEIVKKGEYEQLKNKGKADGYVPLSSNTKIDDKYLPDLSQYNEILMYEKRGQFPGTGDKKKLYLDKSTNNLYRYDSDYILLNEKLKIGITQGTAFDGKRGKDLEDKLNQKYYTKEDIDKIIKVLKEETATDIIEQILLFS